MKNLTFLLFLLFVLSCSQESRMPSAAEKSFELDEVVEGLMKEKEVSQKDKKPSKTWKRSNKEANSPTIFVGDSEQLPLKGAQVSVKVDGFRARVLIDAFFFSDKDRQLEGTFKMRLPQGATPYYFAFGQSVLLGKDSIPILKKEEIAFSAKKIEEMRSKTWTAPKIARVVPKEKAAFAYGQTVRRRVDPALVEWAGADVYNCSIFPLAPNTMHRIVIGYDVNLTSIDRDWVYNFQVPGLDGPLVLDFDVAEVRQVTISPNIQVETQNGRKTFRLINPAQREITIRYPELSNFSLNNTGEKTPYFAATITPPELPSMNAQVSDNAIVALDISLSSNPVKFNIWLKLTEAILANNQNTIKRFNVLLFNIESYWWKEGWVDNTPENVRAFLAFANKLSLEGASDINHAFSTIANTSWAKNTSDNIFLMSDGDDTWGESDTYEMVKNILDGDRLFAYNTGLSGTNIKKLNHFARKSGGAVFSVTGEDEVNNASKAFLSTPWKIEKVSVSGTEDLLIAGRPQYLYAGQKLLISGRGKLEKSKHISMTLSQNGISKQISMPIKNSISSELATRFYGQLATNTLEGFGYATENKAIAYAKHFAVPGNTCSLLMLESEADYQQYNIKASEDAYVVKSTSVNQIVASVLQDIEALLGSAKNKFKHWLTKLTQTDGVDFKIPTALEMIIDKTPESKFVVLQKNLQTKSRNKSDISPAFLKAIGEPQLDYDLVSKEASRRATDYSPADGLKALSSLIEKNPGNTILARDVAYSALAWNQNEQAYFLFRRVLESRPYEPQTYLAIAKSLAKSGNQELAMLYYEIALTANWNARFGAFRRIAALDYLHLLGALKDQSNFLHQDYAQGRYQTLRGEFKEKSADLMMVISWNTDNTDIDLHVKEPTGEECFYQNRNTKIGGHMTDDVTQGYGPEMYILEKAKKGKYNVRVKYYSSNRNRMSTRTKVYATIYKNWGTKEETVTTKVVALKDNKQMHDIVIIGM